MAKKQAESGQDRSYVIQNRKGKCATFIRWIAADTEDDESTNTSLLTKRVTKVCALTDNGERFLNNGDTREFLAWLLSKASPKRKLIVYFHNLQYDLGAFFAESLDELNIALVGSRIIYARWRKGIEFRDSFNLWPMSLEKVGNAVGLKKLARDNSDEYVMRDVEILHRAIKTMESLGARFDVALPCTLGGLAVRIWDSLGGANFQEANEIVREAMFGGRTELFCSGGEGNILCTDINSLYPFCMTLDYPGQCYEMDRLPLLGIAEVTIKVPIMDIAPLPFRREDGSIMFPCGTFRGMWTMVELREALSLGCEVEELHWAYGTDEASKPYKAYVDTIYGMRLQSKDSGESLMLKLLLNNLYGKLCASGRISMSLNLCEEDATNIRGTAYGSKVLVPIDLPCAPYANFMHGAYVTAYGRVTLARFLRMIPAHLLIYCDTDSIFFFWPNDKPPFETGTVLGQMKIEAKIRSMQVLCPKVYRFDNRTKAKGVPKRYQDEFFETRFCEYLAPYRMKEAIRYYDRNNSKPLSIWHKVFKHLQTEYSKKRFDKKTGRYHSLVITGCTSATKTER